MYKYVFLLFLCLIFITPLPHHWLGASSFLSGTVFFLSILFFTNTILFGFKINIKSFKIITGIFLFFICHLFLLQFILREGDFSRGFFSIVLFILMLFGAYIFSNDIFYFSNNQFNKIINFIVIMFYIVFICKYIPQIQNNAIHIKPIMPFNEPSHFVVFFLPFYYFKFFTASTQKEKYLILIIGLIIGILSNNLTMIVGVFLGAFIGFRSYIFLIALILFLIFPFISNYIDLGYFTSRLNIDKNTDNLSVLVIIQGWQLAYEGFIKSFGLGIGMQQLGFVELHTEAGYIIEKVTGSKDGVNVTDAGITAPKIISEFGFFGIIAILVYIFYFIKFTINIKKTNSAVLIFAYSIYISFAIQLFIRGIGYFNAPFFLFLTSIFIILKNKSLKIN